jgi:NADH-quinone oxidoreductase subunit M
VTVLGVDILTFLVFFPLLGAIGILLAPKKGDAPKWISLVTTLVTFAVSVPLFLRFDPANTGMQFAVSVPWIDQFGIRYAVGIDGVSLFMVLLTTFIMPLTVLSSWTSIKDRVAEFQIMLLLLTTGMIGVFVALDFFLFYVFWEAMLIPMYFLIGIWGGTRRIYAAVKFFLYTMVGSLLMLVAIAVMIWVTRDPLGGYSFDIVAMYDKSIPAHLHLWLFLAFALAFAIKVPMFPFHTWLPDAHVEAPTAGSVILAGVLLKMGTYGFLRFCLPLFPEVSLQVVPWMALLAVIGIIYGALVATVQKDVKKLVAYSSVSHLGFVMLGIFAFTVEGVSGGVVQMVNHGLSTGALFLLVGMIYDRRHTRLIVDFGGIVKVMPAFSALLLIITLASIGLPGLNGFVGEFLILLGAWKSPEIARVYVVLAATGVILAAVYMLWMYQRVIFGTITNPENERLQDLTLREWVVLAPLVAGCFWIGLYPAPLLDRIEPTVEALLRDRVGVELPHPDRGHAEIIEVIPGDAKRSVAASTVEVTW